jgi:hypothetical protein
MEGVDGINLIHIRAQFQVLVNSNKPSEISERLSAYNEGLHFMELIISIYGLFYYAVNSSDFIASSGMMITE